MKFNILIEMDGAEDIKVASNIGDAKDGGIKQSALRIKNYCNGRRCENCVFRNETYCILNTHTPFEWNIEEESK